MRRPILGLLTVVALLAAFSIYVYILHTNRTSSDRRYWRIASSLRSVVQALENYQDAHAVLPITVIGAKESSDASSWRFYIYPWIESVDIPYDPEQAWTASINQQIAQRHPTVYCFRGNYTNVMAVTGEGALFGVKNGRLQDADADQVVITSVNYSGVHWMQAGDIDINDITSINQLMIDDIGPCLAFADGDVWIVDARAPLDLLKQFMSTTGAKKHDRNRDLRPYARIVWRRGFGENPIAYEDGEMRTLSDCAH